MENIDVLFSKAAKGDTGSLAQFIHYVATTVGPKAKEDTRLQAWAWYRLGQLERILDGTGNWQGYVAFASAAKMGDLQNWALKKAVSVYRDSTQCAA